MDDRVVVVTGASSGLGAGFARALARVGARVVVVARRADRLADLVTQLRALGATALAVPADLADPEDAQRVAQTAIEEFGRIDGLVNNAGVGSAVPAVRETPEGFRAVLDINLFGVFWMAQAVAQRMEHGGSIVNISSVLGLVAPRYPQAAYAASKAGVIGLTRDLAGEWSQRRGIRVNALCPGYFETELTATASGVLQDMVATESMLGRFGRQEELDAAMLFLISPASSYVTGTTLTVDGGLTSY